MKVWVTAIAVMMLFSGTAVAQTEFNPVGLEWDHNTEADLAGYRVYQSTVSGNYPAEYTEVPAGTNSVTLSACPDGTMYWVLTAVDLAGNESGRSNEVSAVFNSDAPAPPVGCQVVY